VLNHPPYSLVLSPCDYFLFPKLKLPLKERLFEDVQDIQGAVTSSLQAKPQEDVQRSFQSLLDRATRCISAEGMSSSSSSSSSSSPPLGATALREPWPPVLFASTGPYPELSFSILQSPYLVVPLERHLAI
jgi:hypothetical protein